jgi:hypothetical protein
VHTKTNKLKINTSDTGWQKQVGEAMKKKLHFELITSDREWNPNSDSPRDIAKWIWGTAFPGWVASLLIERGVGIGATATIAGTSTPPPGGTPLDGGEKLAIAGAGVMMLLGAGMILLAFFDPEPTTKLGLLLGGGIATIIGGGAVLLTVILTRKNYEWEMEVDKETGQVKWKAKPI